MPILALASLRPAAFAVLALALPLAARSQTNDAAIDPSFAPHETPAPGNDVSGVRALAVQPDGMILAGGDFDDNFLRNNITGRQSNLTRLKPDGHYDPAFKFTGVSSLVETIHLLPDGRLLISGFFDSVGVTARDGIARLNADGTVDASFGPAGSYTHPGSRVDIHGVATQADGKVLIGGAYGMTLSDNSLRANLMRLTADGAADPGFVVNGNDSVGVVGAVALQPDGKILAGGNDLKILARYEASGAADPTFSAHFINGRNFGNPGATIYALAVQPDGKILAGGNFYAGDLAVGRGSLARFNADGSLDPTFDARIDTTVQILALALQANGKIIVGGNFTTFNGVTCQGLVRVNADGSVDPSFDPGEGARNDNTNPAIIKAIALQPDGKTLIGGNLNSYQGQPRAGIARLGGGLTVPTPPPVPADLADLSGTMTGVKAALNGSGKKFQVTGKLTVTNSGALKAKNVEVAAYLSPGPTFDPGAARLISLVSLRDEGFPKVKNGKPVTFNAKFKAKAADIGPTSGKYLLIVIDPRDAIKENDEANNVALTQLLP